MSHRILKHFLFLPGCMVVPIAHASTPMKAPVVIEAPAEHSPAVDYPSEEEDHEMFEEACGMDPELQVDIRVRAGETLDHFARWTESTVEGLAALNEIPVQAPLLPGQALILPIDESELDGVEKKRVEDAEAKLARYIAKRGGLAGIAAHEVKTGETAWYISKREAKVPVWVLSAFNTKVDMDALRAGDTIYLPVMGQTLGERFDAQAEATVGGTVAEH